MKIKKNISIRGLIMRNMILIVVLLTIILTLTGSLMYYRNLVDTSNASRMDSLSAIAHSIDAKTGNVEYCSYLLATNTQLMQDLISDLELVVPDETDIQKYRQMEYHLLLSIRTVINNLSSLCPVYAIGVYYEDGTIRYYNGIRRYDLYDLSSVEAAVEQVKNNENGIVYTEPFRIASRELIGIVRSISDPVTLENYGEIAVLVETNTLFNYVMNASYDRQSDHNLYIVDTDGQVIYSQKSASQTIDSLGVCMDDFVSSIGLISTNGTYGDQVLYARLNEAPWYLIEIENSAEYIDDILHNAMIQPLVALGCGIIALLLCVYTSSRIERPIRRLILEMTEVEGGNRREVTESDRIREIKMIGQGLNHMNAQLQTASDIIHRKEIAQKEAELYALQAQIDPHFLYNTLEIINMRLLVAEQYDLSDMVVNLADVMRFNIASTDIIIRLKEELDVVERYLEIMQRRLGNRLDFSINYSADAAAAPILKLLIQPLVENAVIHGIEKCTHPCTVGIQASVNGDYLDIEITDDGDGMDEETVLRINDGTYTRAYGRHSGVGMVNILKRVRLYYGDTDLLKVSSVPGKGTTVKLHLPTNKITVKENSHEGIRG